MCTKITHFDSRQLLTQDDLQRKTLNEDKLHSFKILERRQSLMKYSFGGGRPLMEDNLLVKMIFDGRQHCKPTMT